MKLTTVVFLLLTSFAFGKEPLFLLHEIDRTQSETVQVADFDRDGRLDVCSGGNMYIAPDWKKIEFMAPPTPGGQIRTNDELVLDVNKDGNPDVVIGCWGTGGIWYYENHGKNGVKLTGEKITDTKDLEGLLAEDVDNDGTVDILPAFWSDQPYYWLKIVDGKFVKRPVGPTGMLHGLGFADIDGDGKKDILTGRGWFQQIDVAKDQWEYHPDFSMIHESSIPMIAYDVNADGLMDVIDGEAHEYGLFWLEQKITDGKRSWIKHEIDPNYSQIHVLALADLNGDGKPELAAGKRYRAHNDGDPGAFDPISINYYTIETGKEPKFTRYPLAFNSLAGVGTQCVVVDLDADGDLDLVYGGKSGQYWFENLLVNKVDNKKRDVLMNRFPSKL